MSTLHELIKYGFFFGGKGSGGSGGSGGSTQPADSRIHVVLARNNDGDNFLFLYDALARRLNSVTVAELFKLIEPLGEYSNITFSYASVNGDGSIDGKAIAHTVDIKFFDGEEVTVIGWWYEFPGDGRPREISCSTYLYDGAEEIESYARALENGEWVDLW